MDTKRLRQIEGLPGVAGAEARILSDTTIGLECPCMLRECEGIVCVVIDIADVLDTDVVPILSGSSVCPLCAAPHTLTYRYGRLTIQFDLQPGQEAKQYKAVTEWVRAN